MKLITAAAAAKNEAAPIDVEDAELTTALL